MTKEKIKGIKIIFHDRTFVVYEIGENMPVWIDENLDNTIIKKIDKIEKMV